LFPTAAVGFAYYCEVRGLGFFNMFAISGLIEITSSVLLLDLLIYTQHVVFHKAPLLWRLHRMHHADLDYDVTTGARFHPIEIILSMLIKFCAVLFLGISPLAVIIFEILLNATAMFNHGNIKIPLGIDKLLRLILVTPDMHRVHHSVLVDETNSNYGFNLPWWDYIFGTYKAQPDKGHAIMMIGLPEFRTKDDLRLDRLLVQPFRES
jgi:sterol desaturase/sphingolipid hydroxylase (fatty acid hydroxylase superfamily)